jgi:hypothetical protein
MKASKSDLYAIAGLTVYVLGIVLLIVGTFSS